MAIVRLGLRVADADADAVRARARQPSRRGEKQNFVLRMFERCFEAVLGSTSGRSTGCSRQVDHAHGHPCHDCSARSGSTSSCPRASFPTEDTGYVHRHHRRRIPTSAFPAMVERQRKVADIVRADPAVDYVNSTAGAGGPNSCRNSGRMLVALKPQQRTRQARGRSWRACAKRPMSSPAWRCSSSRSRTSISAASSSKSQYQYTLQSNDTDDALSNGAANCATKWPRFPDCMTSPPTSTSPIRR